VSTVDAASNDACTFFDVDLNHKQQPATADTPKMVYLMVAVGWGV
jgi:hypothetical protein